MRQDQTMGLGVALGWGFLGMVAGSIGTFYYTGDGAATMTVAIAAPIITVFLYLLFERLTA